MRKMLLLFICSLVTLTCTLAQAPSIEWQKCIGGELDVSPESIVTTKDGGLIMSAGTSSHDGDISGNHRGYIVAPDVWIAKLNVGSVIDETTDLHYNNSMTIYQDMLFNSITIILNKPSESSNIIIYNIYGQIVYSGSMEEKDKTIDIDAFASGAYIVFCGHESAKFVKY